MRFLLFFICISNCFSLHAMNALRLKIIDDVSKKVLLHYVKHAVDKKVTHNGITMFLEEGQASFTIKTMVDEYSEEHIAVLLREHQTDINPSRTTFSRSITDVVHNSNKNEGMQTVKCPNTKTIFTREEFEKLKGEFEAMINQSSEASMSPIARPIIVGESNSATDSQSKSEESRSISKYPSLSEMVFEKLELRRTKSMNEEIQGPVQEPAPITKVRPKKKGCNVV